MADLNPWTPGPWAVEQTAAATYRLRVAPESIDQMAANARLISLAPEMAEFIAAVLEEATENGGGSLSRAEEAWRHFGVEARTLLARARGQEEKPPEGG